MAKHVALPFVTLRLIPPLNSPYVLVSVYQSRVFLNNGFMVQLGLGQKAFSHDYTFTCYKTRGIDCQTEAIAPECDPSLSEEMTHVIKDWWARCKQIYLESGILALNSVNNSLQQIMNWRKQILSGSLPKDELKSLRTKVARAIDVGNARLGLDLIVRDNLGQTLEAEQSSITQMYKSHLTAVERIQMETKAPTSARRLHSAYSLLITLQTVSVKLKGEFEVVLALYDAKQQQFFSENFTIICSPYSTEEMNHKSLFVDLGGKDMERNRVYLVCQIIKRGPIEAKESTLPKKSNDRIATPTQPAPGYVSTVRQPYVVGVTDLTELFHETATNNSILEEERQLFAPLSEMQGSLDSVLKMAVNTYRFTSTTNRQSADRAVSVENDNIQQNGVKNELGLGAAGRDQGVMMSIQLLSGSLEHVRKSKPHLFASTGIGGAVGLVRKMGFPEVILRDDVRNDLYVTLQGADLSHIKSEKNIEVRVSLVDEQGQVFPESIATIGGNGLSTSPYFHSLVLYHQDKPQWGETVKVALPEENPGRAHVQFTFRHRSSNESKDRKERTFALAWLRLFEDNGTMIADGRHELLVYKLDSKMDSEHDVSYQNLPGRKQDLEKAGLGSAPPRSAIHSAGFVLSAKDTFLVRTVTCSTSVTQNKELLGVLEWESKRVNLRESLANLLKQVDEKTGEEVVKFLEHLLDVLFNILTKSNEYDELVFDGLVYVIRLVDEIRYQNFKPVLERYLEDKFSAALAYLKLLPLLCTRVTAAATGTGADLDHQKYLNTLKSMGYLMDFIVKSRQLHASLTPTESSVQFRSQISGLLNSLAKLMKNRQQVLHYQGVALKYLPEALPHFTQVFDKTDLTQNLSILFQNLDFDRLRTQRLVCLQDLVSSELFTDSECRPMLLTLILDQVIMYMERGKELQLCAQLLANVLEQLYSKDSVCEATEADLNLIVGKALRTVIQCTISLLGTKQEKRTLHDFMALLLAILDELSSHHYVQYVNRFSTQLDLRDFLMEILMLFQDLVCDSRFPADWFQMLCLQNRTLLKMLKYISSTIKERFAAANYDSEVWATYFRTAVSFITQRPLQLELFDAAKRAKLLSRHQDMRVECALDARSKWFTLNMLEKLDFVPQLVGPFLQVCLLPESTLRDKIIPIFHDMIVVEYHSSPTRNSGGKMVGQQSKGNFSEFEKELITQLDTYVDKGMGDNAFVTQFVEIMSKHSESHAELIHESNRLIEVVERLLRRLFEYRQLKSSAHDCADNRMNCTVSLLEFYGEIKHWDLYIKYVYKLYQLHLSHDNYVEAAFTLQLHADKLSWSSDPLSDMHLRHHRTARKCETERQLKIFLYEEIIHLFEADSYWECAIRLCKELQNIYETRTLQYDKLPSLLNKMARLYEEIIKAERPSSEYFRVGFYGLSFPSFLTNKEFVFRGNSYEKLGDFTSRMLPMFPAAKLLTSMDPPSESIRQSNAQHMQIFAVKPIQGEKMPKPDGDINVDRLIRLYYKYNEVQKFEYSRKYRKQTAQSQRAKEQDPNNEFIEMWLQRTVLVTNSSLPGILRCFPVMSSQQYELSPLEVAIETMTSANNSLTDLIDEVGTSANPSVKPLQAKLQGILNPAVMGGIDNYKVFFSASFSSVCTDQERELVSSLCDLIAGQVPRLEMALYVHAERVTAADLPFHEYLKNAFCEHRTRIQTQFGAKPSILPLGGSLTPPRLRTPHTLRQPQMHHASTLDATGSSVDRRSCERSASLSSTPDQSSSGKLAASLAGLKGVGYVATLNRAKSGRKPIDTKDSSLKRLSNISTGSGYSNDSSTSSTVTPIVLDQQLTPRRPRRPKTSRSSLASRRSDSTPDMYGFGEEENNSSSETLPSGRTESESLADSGPSPPPLPPRPKTSVAEPIYDSNANASVPPPVPRKPITRVQKPLPPLPTA